MNKIYKAKKIYLLRLAQVTDYKDSGWSINGWTKYKLENKYRFAKLIKKQGRYKFYKLISNGLIVSDNHDRTKCGDYFCNFAEPLKMILTEPCIFVTKKQLLAGESYINNNEEIENNKEV